MPIALPYLKSVQAPPRPPGMQRGPKLRNLWQKQGPETMPSPSAGPDLC